MHKSDRIYQKARLEWTFILIVSILTVILLFVPTYRSTELSQREYVKVRILEVDDTGVEQYGIVKTGSQKLRLEVLRGSQRGVQLDGVNLLMGKLELDSIYQTGDTALAVLFFDRSGSVGTVQLLGPYRLGAMLVLLSLFVGFLVLFAGSTGIKAVISFLFSGVMIWKVMLPLFLAGYDPVLISLVVILIVSAVILFFVGTFSHKGITSFAGSIAGIGLTCVLAIIFTRAFSISGAVKPFAETLLYSGYPHLDLTRILISGIFLSASGAVMDIAMDVASAMEEVALHHPRITRRELLLSGFRVGRSVVGTMTTTLLLAYSGSYMALLMVFMAQGTPTIGILNLSYVASEILTTLVGSLGLVATAPLTAIVASLLYRPVDASGKQ